MSPATALDVATKLLDTVLDLIPEEQAGQLLSAVAIRRGNAAADAAEALKFGVLATPSTDDEP